MVLLYTIQSLKLGHLITDDIPYILHSIVTEMCMPWDLGGQILLLRLPCLKNWESHSHAITLSLSVNVKMFVSVSPVVSIER